MKKILTLLLAVVLVCALTACSINFSTGSDGSNNNNNNNNNNNSSSNSTSSVAETPAPAPTEVPMKDFVFGAMKVTLPDDFSDKSSLLPEDSDMKYFFANSDSTVAFAALSEEKSGFKGTVVESLDDYLDVQHDNSKGDVTSEIKEDDGLKYFDYEADGSDGTTFKYFTTAYETDDDYWFVQMYSTKSEYPSYEEDFLSWAHSVREA